MSTLQSDQIDQTHRALPSSSWSVVGLLLLPFKLLPFWARVVVILGALYYLQTLKTRHKLYLKAGRYKLERRRKAGIPDSDKRDFKVAAAAALRTRKDEHERLVREKGLRKRAGGNKDGWEQWGEANGLREREVSQQASREDSVAPGIRYPSLGPEAQFNYASSDFAFGQSREGTLQSGQGDSEDERREQLMRDTAARRARGEGFGSGPILPPSQTVSADESLRPSKRSHKGVSSVFTAFDEKRIKVKQEPVSDDDMEIPSEEDASRQQQCKVRKRDDNDSGDEDRQEDDEDELMSSGSERLVRPPSSKIFRKKQRRRRQLNSYDSQHSDVEDMDASSASDDDREFTDDHSMSSKSRSPSSPPTRPSNKTHKRVISEVGSVTSTRRRSSLPKKRRKSNGTPAPISEEEESADEGSKPKPAESWQDPSGIHFRLGANGRGSERLVLVKKQVRKFPDMPVDSEHPNKDELITANFEQWVNEKEFVELKAKRQLAWQNSDDEDEKDGADEVKVLEASSQETIDGVKSVLLNSSTLGRSGNLPLGSVYQVKNPSSTPLRPSQSLASLHELYTSSGLFSTNSSRPASPASSLGTSTPNKPRFSSTASRVRGSPYGKTSAARQAREAEEQKRLDEELAKKAGEEKTSAAASPAPKALPAPATLPPPAAPKQAPYFSTPAASGSSPFSFGGGASKETPSKEGFSTPALAPISKAPAEASNFFAIPSSPSSVPASSTTASAPSMSASHPFAAKPSPTPIQPAKPVKPSPLGTNSFSFGASSKPVDSVPAPAAATPSSVSKVSFSFGAPAPTGSTTPSAAPTGPVPASAAAAPTPKPPMFAFSAPSLSPKPAPAAAEPPKLTQSFSFGAPAGPPAAPPAATTTNPFSFGAPAAKADPPKADAPKPSFSFGGASTPSASFASTPTGASTPSFGASSSFAFGASSTAPAVTSTAPPANGNAFGTPSSSTSAFGSLSSTPAPSSAPSFSFGSTATPAPASTTRGSFSFGASKPAEGAAAAPKQAFSFGSTIQPAEGSMPAGAPKAPFSFGSTGTSGGGFSFGK